MISSTYNDLFFCSNYNIRYRNTKPGAHIVLIPFICLCRHINGIKLQSSVYFIKGTVHNDVVMATLVSGGNCWCQKASPEVRLLIVRNNNLTNRQLIYYKAVTHKVYDL